MTLNNLLVRAWGSVMLVTILCAGMLPTARMAGGCEVEVRWNEAEGLSEARCNGSCPPVGDEPGVCAEDPAERNGQEVLECCCNGFEEGTGIKCKSYYVTLPNFGAVWACDDYDCGGICQPVSAGGEGGITPNWQPACTCQ
jgi:hypothetical protein